jgi:copper chaperone CopZ
MEKHLLTIPALYGDHHTTAVRGILGKIDGVSDVFVSASRRQVALRYDPKKVKPEAIERALSEQGYEPGVPQPSFASSTAERATRHSATYAGVGTQLAFAQPTLIQDARPLWPCPGFDPRTRPIRE